MDSCNIQIDREKRKIVFAFDNGKDFSISIPQAKLLVVALLRGVEILEVPKTANAKPGAQKLPPDGQ
jgi:hypothetical protein